MGSRRTDRRHRSRSPHNTEPAHQFAQSDFNNLNHRNRLHSGWFVCRGRGCSSTGPIGFTQSHTLSYFSTACIKSCFYCVASATHWAEGSSSNRLAMEMEELWDVPHARRLVFGLWWCKHRSLGLPLTNGCRGVRRFGFFGVHTPRPTDQTRDSNKARKEAAKS